LLQVIKLTVLPMSDVYCVQHLRNISGQDVKWAELLDKLTIAGHSHQTAVELYSEITDHLPLLMEVSHRLTDFLCRSPRSDRHFSFIIENFYSLITKFVA